MAILGSDKAMTSLAIFVLVLLTAELSDGTLSPSDKKNKKSKNVPPIQTGPVSQTVYMKDLVTSKINDENDIISHQGSYHNDVKFSNFDTNSAGL